MTEYNLPGRAESYWIASTPETDYPALEGEITVDVAVVGGGLAGLSAAYEFKEAGMRVAVLEAGRLLEQVTGNTTAKITYQHDLIYRDLIDGLGKEMAEHYAQLNRKGLQRIFLLSEQFGIECDLQRAFHVVYTTNEKVLKHIEHEVEAARSLGLPASWVDSIELPVPCRAGVRFEEQAHFHPRKFLLGLAKRIEGDGSAIYERSRVLNVEEGKPCRIKLEHGEVRAHEVLLATHFPIIDPGRFYARVKQERSYVLAVRLRSIPSEGMYIDTGEDDYHSFRTQPDHHGTLALFGGQQHETGREKSTGERYHRLEEYVRRHFDVESVEYRWSTQDVFTPDDIPYIGRPSPNSEHLLVATGFKGWGFTTAMGGALVLRDLVLKRNNPWIPLVDPNRTGSQLKKVSTIVMQNLKVAKDFLKGRLSEEERNDFSRMEPGEGRVIELHGQKVAVCRDRQGNLHLVSAICTHMGCAVVWNEAEESWDCPCHGSRFSAGGKVLDTPAISDLPPADEAKDQPDPGPWSAPTGT